jgi:hypothetical protein
MSVRNFFLNNIFTLKDKLFPIFKWIKWIEDVDGTYSWRLYYRERSWRLSTAHEYPSYRLQLPKATHMFILFSCNNGFFNLTTAHGGLTDITMIAQSQLINFWTRKSNSYIFCIDKQFRCDRYTFKIIQYCKLRIQSLVVNAQPVDEIFVDFKLIISDVVEGDCMGRTAVHVL